ncbi:MAG: lactate utilization protein C [Bacteroidia bacterium]
MNQQVTSKERILKKIRQALTVKSKASFQGIDLDSNIYVHTEEDNLAEIFAKNFTQNNGQFFYCNNQFDCIDKLLDLIELKKWKHIHADTAAAEILRDTGIDTLNAKAIKHDKIPVSVTFCESLIARTGTILLSSFSNTRKLPVFCKTHIVIGKLSQLVPDVKDALLVLKNKFGRNMPSGIYFITGPSKSLALPAISLGQIPETVYGAFGPAELFLFLIDDSKRS